MPGDFSLKVDPAEPLSGLDITFTLTGLSPWQAITVAFIDPLGRPVGWVTENEVLLVGAGDVPIIERSLYSNGSGDVSWIRIGSKDREGTWTLQVNIDGESNTITYPVAQLQLPPQDSETVGVELSRYQGSASNTFYSTLVPVATAVNLQAHLAWVVDRLAEELGVQSSQIPNIYLTGNQNLLQQVARATGDEIGFEDGYYRSSGTRPGIFMRTNLFRTGVQGILTHEYTHLLLQEVALDQSLPSWLNEGLSRHTEYGIGLQGARPNAVKVALFRSADLAQAAVLSGALPPLTSLESQTDWNAQSDDYLINLQYAEAYMAVQYMAETYGTSAPIEVVQAIGRGSQLSGAIPEVTGRQYRDFRQSFVEWLQDWEDPERAQIRSYLDSLEPILDSLNSISARRAVDLQSGASFSTRIPVKQGLVTDAQSLLDQLGELSPSDLLSDLHHEATTYLSRFVEWLTLDLGYIETFEDALLIRANGMIAEINARDAVLNRRVNSLNFVYNLA